MPRTVLLALLICLLTPAAASAQLEAPPEDAVPPASLAPAPVLAPAPAPTSRAAIPVAVGIGDQSASMFDSPLFQALGVKKVRHFIKWDAIDRPGELALADAWVNRAVALKQQVLMHISSNDLTNLKAAGINPADIDAVLSELDEVDELLRDETEDGQRCVGAYPISAGDRVGSRAAEITASRSAKKQPQVRVRIDDPRSL